LFANPKAPNLRLLRRIQYPTGEFNRPLAEQAAGIEVHISYGMSPGITTVPTSTETKSVNHRVGRAQWWVPSKDVIQSPNVRYLEGEIHLSATLPPSCDLETFRVEVRSPPSPSLVMNFTTDFICQYSVELMPFRTRNFEPEHPPSRGKSIETNNALASNPVEITTLYREDEPIPTVYSEAL
jgi:hypothetical protein